MKRTENSFFHSPSPSDVALRQSLLHRLSVIEQAHNEKDLELDTLKDRSLQLKALKNMYENKILQQRDILMKSVNNVMLLKENLKKMCLEFLNHEEEQNDVDIDNMSYEQLLELQEAVGHVSKGLTEQQMKGLRRERFEEFRWGGREKGCMVCQEQFDQGAGVIVLKCGHVFHEQCIGEWLKKEKVCPLCKGECI